MHVRAARQQKRPEVALGHARLRTPPYVALAFVNTLFEQRSQVGRRRDLRHLRHTVRNVEVARDLGPIIRRKVAPPEMMRDERLVVTDRGDECAPLFVIASFSKNQRPLLVVASSETAVPNQ